MRATRRRRPRKRRICVPPGTDLDVLADRVAYVGSPEHKDIPTFAGQPRLRGDTSCCPRETTDREVVSGRLRSSIRRGAIGAPREGGYPHYVLLQPSFWPPSGGLRSRVSRPVVDDDDTDELALEFGVSSRVIEHQLANHRIARIGSAG